MIVKNDKHALGVHFIRQKKDAKVVKILTLSVFVWGRGSLLPSSAETAVVMRA